MKLIPVLLSVLFSGNLLAQLEITYLNKYLEECSKKDATYKRSYTEIGDGLYDAEITYFDDTLKATGTYALIEGEMVPHGKFVFYFENGNKESEGDYNKGYKSGEWKRYMNDGTELRSKFYQASFGEVLEAFMKN